MLSGDAERACCNAIIGSHQLLFEGGASFGRGSDESAHVACKILIIYAKDSYRMMLLLLGDLVNLILWSLVLRGSSSTHRRKFSIEHLDTTYRDALLLGLFCLSSLFLSRTLLLLLLRMLEWGAFQRRLDVGARGSPCRLFLLGTLDIPVQTARIFANHLLDQPGRWVYHLLLTHNAIG